MERENHVLPECYVDTNLVNTILGKSCNHQKGCPTVFKVMNERLKDTFAVGIIDKDKREPKALEDYRLICNDDYLYVYKHQSRHHYILQVAPAEEAFILHAAQELRFDLSNYGLPTEMNALKSYTKKVDAKNSNIFQSLFHVLKDAPSISKMSNILHYLINNQYNAEQEELKRIFQQQE